MPPRFAYWTIIVEGKPTAFRAQDRDELVPTFKQLQGKHPDAVMMWFARGRLWASPDEQRAAEHRGGTERRKPDWRPGGEHRDPRARFDIPRDEKRRRFAEKLRRQGAAPEGDEPPDDAPTARPPGTDRPLPSDARPGGDRPRTEWRPSGGRPPRPPFENRDKRE